MGLLVPHHRQFSQERNFSGRPATTWGTVLTGHATPHSLGTKVEIDAATAYEATRIRITFKESFVSATLTDMLCNLYIGAAAAEQVLIPNMLCGWATTIAQGAGPVVYEFPIRIPRGSRLSADLRSLITVDTVNILVELFNDGVSEWYGSKVETLGAVTASSRGTQVTPGAASEGTLTSIGTTGRRYGYIQPMMLGNTDVTQTVGLMALDIGTVSAVIPGLENFVYWTSASELGANLENGRYCDIASGTALYARLQNNDATVEAKSVCLYGVY